MKPVVLLSFLALVVVAGGVLLVLWGLPYMPDMGKYGAWPFWMLGIAIGVLLVLSALYLWLVHHSARHYDHQVHRLDDDQ